ncbi:MAG TPA: alpha/beta hydrolase domain-containing protein [Casimicrobiaceae bacterium]
MLESHALDFRPWFQRMITTVALAFAVALSATAMAAVPNPIVTGPIASTVAPGDPTHNYTFFSSNHDLAGHGYVEEEFFIQGTANRYNTPSLTTATIIDGGHPYMTRIVVRRPADAARFNGTVLVEWYNVTNNFDAENTWFFAWEHIMRAGYAWVGVSAQRVGVNALKTWSPGRYGLLDVTQGSTINNDALSYDIFSQAGQAIKQPVGVDVLHGLQSQHIFAIGESQSAMRLSIYANSIQPLANLYEGILLLSSLGNAIRTDTMVPVFKVLTEYDVTGANEANVRQADTNMFRTWEVAGTSHVDQHLRASREPLELRDLGVSSEALLAPQCAIHTIGTRVPTTYVLASAFDHLVAWAEDGTPPPVAPRIQIATFGSPSLAARDGLGLALGGIRLSEIDVPIAYNVGTNSGPGACVRWGYSVPFDDALLKSLYRNHGQYVSRVVQVNERNVESGYILEDDAEIDNEEAAHSDVGK